jgi:hypothetical protein
MWQDVGCASNLKNQQYAVSVASLLASARASLMALFPHICFFAVYLIRSFLSHRSPPIAAARRDATTMLRSSRESWS